MYSIGTFSKMNKVTTKTLRYYDEIGLLKPNNVDKFTGYRYYSKDQITALYRINTLKEIGLSLIQIKEVLDNPSIINLILEIKQQEAIERIREEKIKLIKIENYLRGIKEEENKMYDVKIKSLPEVKVASMRQIIPNHQALFHICPNIMAKEMMELECVCAEPAYCFNIYHDGEYKEENIDIEICEAVTEIKEDTEILKFKVIKSVESAVSIMHKGGYKTLGSTYAYAFKWIEENGYKVSDYPRESYIDGIWNKENIEDWLTEIQIPVEIEK